MNEFLTFKAVYRLDLEIFGKKGVSGWASKMGKKICQVQGKKVKINIGYIYSFCSEASVYLAQN